MTPQPSVAPAVATIPVVTSERWQYADYVRLEKTGQFVVRCDTAYARKPWIIAADPWNWLNVGKFVTDKYVELNSPTLIGFKNAEGCSS